MKIRFINNFAFGCFVGSLSTLILAWILDENVGVAFQKNAIYLFTFAATLGAAALALLGTLTVISNQNEIAYQENNRRLLAARAALPPVLSSLYQKAVTGADMTANQKPLKATPKKAQKALRKLAITSSEMLVLKECIKYADEDTSRWLSLIISHFQIHRSRLNSAFFTRGLIIIDIQVARATLEWFLIKIMIEHLFEFSRTGKQPDFELDSTKIRYPIQLGHSGPVYNNWDQVVEDLVVYIDKYGGWSGAAFQRRLLNSST